MDSRESPRNSFVLPLGELVSACLRRGTTPTTSTRSTAVACMYGKGRFVHPLVFLSFSAACIGMPRYRSAWAFD